MTLTSPINGTAIVLCKLNENRPISCKICKKVKIYWRKTIYFNDNKKL